MAKFSINMKNLIVIISTKLLRLTSRLTRTTSLERTKKTKISINSSKDICIMKIKTKITNVTHDDLVNLLSTAGYGSYWLGLNYDSMDFLQLEDNEKYDCVEDKMAALLLAGKSVELYDMYAEDADDFYGKLPHSWDEENQTMDYTVTLKDIVKGIEKALSKGEYEARCAMDLIDEESYNLDQPEAEDLVQIVLFGEIIYG